MIESHIQKLIKIGSNVPGYIGNNSWIWAKSVLGPNEYIDPDLDSRFNRYDLFEYCNDRNKKNKDVLVAILSWGGMRRDHGRRLFRNYEILDPIIKCLREGHYKTRIEAFLIFQQLRNNGNLPGLGIGYFTKLICFLSPQLNGYIMDQWVSKSINLLTGEQIVYISNKWVNDNNDAETYEVFCSIIDDLGKILNCTGLEAEKRIFSVGRGKGEWRKYLIDNYS